MSCGVCAACSPAQAAAAPAAMPDQSAVLATQYGRYTGPGTASNDHASSHLQHSPRVVSEPLRSAIKVLTVSLAVL